MATRYEDGVSVLGIENKSLVDDIEMEFQREKITKSELNEMILRAVADADGTPTAETPVISEVNKVEYRNEDGILVIPKGEFQAFIQVLNKASGESGITITQDNLTENLNAMLKWISSYEETKSVTKAEEKPMKDENDKDEEEKEKEQKKEKSVSDADTEKCESDEYGRPFGGATSLSDIMNYQKASEMEFSVYRLYSWFGAASQNILNSEDEVANKMANMQKLLTEFKSMLTPAGLSTLKSTIKNEETSILDVVNSLSTSIQELSNKVDNLSSIATAKAVNSEETPKDETDKEVPAWKSIVDKVSNVLKEAVTKSEQERHEVFQGLLTEMGTDLLELHKSLLPSSDKAETVTSMEKMVDEKIAKQTELINQQAAITNQQIADLTAAIQNMVSTKSTVTPVQRTVPVSKSITPPPVLLQPNSPSKPMTIREAAMRSTLGR